MRHAAIAQLDRVTDYESVGRGFESLLPYQKENTTQSGGVFLFRVGRDSNPFKCLMLGMGWPPVQKLVASIRFAPQGKSAIESLLPYFWA